MDRRGKFICTTVSIRTHMWEALWSTNVNQMEEKKDFYLSDCKFAGEEFENGVMMIWWFEKS